VLLLTDCMCACVCVCVRSATLGCSHARPSRPMCRCLHSSGQATRRDCLSVEHKGLSVTRCTLKQPNEHTAQARCLDVLCETRRSTSGSGSSSGNLVQKSSSSASSHSIEIEAASSFICVRPVMSSRNVGLLKAWNKNASPCSRYADTTYTRVYKNHPTLRGCNTNAPGWHRTLCEHAVHLSYAFPTIKLFWNCDKKPRIWCGTIPNGVGEAALLEWLVCKSAGACALYNGQPVRVRILLWWLLPSRNTSESPPMHTRAGGAAARPSARPQGSLP